MSSTDSMLGSPPPDNTGRPRDDSPGSNTAAAAPTAPRLSLTDFLDLASLQEVQDSFAALTRLATTISDADGQPLTTPTDAEHRDLSDEWLDYLITPETGTGEDLTAPIMVEGQQLGSIAIEPKRLTDPSPLAKQRFREAVRKLGMNDEQVSALLDVAEDCFAPNRAASIQFLYLLANNIARLCYQEYHARQRLEELTALYKISTVLSGHRNVQQVLDTAARSAAEVMRVKAVMIRLIDENSTDKELVPRAKYNLSEEYLNKGSIRLEESDIFREAMAGKPVYVQDMTADERVLYPEDAQREGLVSMLCTGMIYQGKPIGVIQLFTEEVRQFSRFDVNLIKAMTNLLATAIENARLDQARSENQRMIRQLRLAADVQRRMLPAAMPHVPPLDVAARYVPCLELGGDFYDFVDLDGHLGLVMGDVVGKGVAASLLMASVRASLRAYAQDVYDLDEVIVRVNTALCRDTLDNEFATLWYGVIDPATLRLTFCNAGHEPPILVRNGQVHWLDVGGMIVGIDPYQEYEKGLWDLEAGDVLLLYTDGLVDSFNFERERFGRDRIANALAEAADRPAGEILNHVLWRMRKFTGLRRSVDDTTLVVVKVNG